MAHDVSASRNLESELLLGISPPGLFGAFNQFHCQHGIHLTGVLIAFCTKNCCSLMIIVNFSSHCLHWEVISAGKFCWFPSGAEPSLFFKDMSMATGVLLHVAHPSLAPLGLVPGINNKLPQVCVLSNLVLSFTSISLLVLSRQISLNREMWSRREKMRPCQLKTGFFSIATNLVLSPEFMMDTSLLIVIQLELVMINVLSASKLAPILTFERFVCHHDSAFMICVTPQDVTPILLLAGHHLYSWAEFVLKVEFPMKNARVKPVI